ncbi:nuclear transport factor 2-like protein [Tenacibaculum amylolyticum]|uniref:hypothetical protein n=1 Tax=Tenacibaculum amylolyticum TaxID=104269 RepID=UPI0038955471
MITLLKNKFWFLLAVMFVACSNTNDSEENTVIDDNNTDLPIAIQAYQRGANSKNIDTYMDAFADDITILDVSREIVGRDNVRQWALNEVIPNGETFNHRRILEQSEGFAKTEVNWLSWVVHYSYWWNEDGKITRMSLQYAN